MWKVGVKVRLTHHKHVGIVTVAIGVERSKVSLLERFLFLLLILAQRKLDHGAQYRHAALLPTYQNLFL
jgi:hypothetical protein